MSVSCLSQPRRSAQWIRAAAALASLAATACSRDVPVAPTPAPAATLVAAADTAPRFAFLTPLGSGTADSASFDAVVAPTVEVCAWSGTACTAPPIVRYATMSDTSAQPLTINRAVGRYEGAWNLLDPRFRTRQTYRIRVLQAGTEIGAVSVDVVLGRWALTRTDGTLPPLSAATTLPIRFTVRQASQAGATCNGGVLTNGLTCHGTIATARQQDRWTFTADSGDYLAITAGRESGATLLPYVRVVSPTGAVVVSSTLNNYSAAEVAVHAPVAGTYTVTVSDIPYNGGGDRTGGYRLTLIKAPGVLAVSPGDQGGALTNGATARGAIDYAGDLDAWTFTADSGDYVAITAGRESGTTLLPYVRVVSPTGAVVVSSTLNNYSAAEVAVHAPVAGTYTVIVGDDSYNDGRFRTGGYRLTLIKAPGALAVSPGDQGGALTNGATARGAIDYGGDLDAWTFTAVAGTRFTVSVSADSGAALLPYIRVVSPAGVVVAASTLSPYTAVQTAATAPVSGTYTVIVGDDAYNDGRFRTGGYQIKVVGSSP